MTDWILSSGFVVLGFVLALIAIVHMVTQRRSPQSAIAWLLVMILLPWIGVPLFLAFGGRKLRALARAKPVIEMTRQAPLTGQTLELDRLLQSFDLPPASSGNRFTLNPDGEAGYQALVALIEGAQESLHFTTFTLGNDPVGRDIIARLAAKAEADVEVCLLLDGVGSRGIGERQLAPLRDAGGEVETFNPMLHRPLRGRSNLRNHRKMTIADGQRVWAGGCNTAEQYIGPTPSPDRWRDLSFLLEGPAVQTFVEIFASDWAFVTERGVTPSLGVAPLAGAEAQTAQVIPSGPDVPGDPLFATLVSACYAAKQRIWLATPYFLPPEAASQALWVAARRGVDVRVVVPDHSDHWMADWARGPDLREVEHAGGQVLRYRPGVMHAKALIVDRAIATVGSANFDDRSLFLNYEVMLTLYDGPGLGQLEQWFQATMAQCDVGLVTPKRPRRIAEGLARTLAPLL